MTSQKKAQEPKATPVAAVASLHPPPALRAVLAPSEPAGAVARLIAPGCWLCGLTKGQFSLLDLVRSVVAVTGPADVTISTWSTGIRDMEAARWLVDAGEIRSLRLLTDRSFPGRQPRYAARLVQLFGPTAIIATRVHAKIAIVRNERWNIAIRSSMNLNRNPRFEQFDLNEGIDICDFLGAWVDELADGMGGAGLEFDESAAEEVFRRALADGVTASGAVAEMVNATEEDLHRAEAKAERVELRAPAVTVSGRRSAPAMSADVPDLASMSVAEVAHWQLGRLALAVTQGDPGSVAYIQAVKATGAARVDLDRLLRVELPTVPSPEDMTPAEWAARVAEDARACSDADLEVYLREYAGRHKLRAMVVDGLPVFQRKGG